MIKFGKYSKDVIIEKVVLKKADLDLLPLYFRAFGGFSVTKVKGTGEILIVSDESKDMTDALKTGYTGSRAAFMLPPQTDTILGKVYFLDKRTAKKFWETTRKIDPGLGVVLDDFIQPFRGDSMILVG